MTGDPSYRALARDLIAQLDRELEAGVITDTGNRIALANATVVLAVADEIADGVTVRTPRCGAPSVPVDQ